MLNRSTMHCPLFSILLCIWLYGFFFSSAPPLWVCLDQRPGDSRTVADSCLPGWVRASCCFISPRVLWHLSLFTCSVRLIPSDRVSSLSLSLFLLRLSVLSPPSSSSFPSLLLVYHPPPLISSFLLFIPSLSSRPRRSFGCVHPRPLLAPLKVNWSRCAGGPLKRRHCQSEAFVGRQHKMGPQGWRHAWWDCSLIMFAMGRPLQSFNYLNGWDREGAHTATVSLL